MRHLRRSRCWRLVLGTAGSLLLLTAATHFVVSKPVPGIGIVVKKGRPPNGSTRTAVTNANGEFGVPLEVGSYVITLPAGEVRAAVARIAGQTSEARQAGPAQVASVRDDAVSLTLRETTGVRVTPCSTNGYTDVALVTVATTGAALTGRLTWDDAMPTVADAARGGPRIVALRDGATFEPRSAVATGGNTRAATPAAVGARSSAVATAAAATAARARAEAATRGPCDAVLPP